MFAGQSHAAAFTGVALSWSCNSGDASVLFFGVLLTALRNCRRLLVFRPARPPPGCIYVQLHQVAARQVERHSRPPTRRRGQAPVQQENPAAATPETAPPAAVLPGGNGGGSTTPGGGEGQQQPGSSSASSGLAGFSDEALELELRRRRGGRNGGVGAGAGGACGQDGGVCVPCFEIA